MSEQRSGSLDTSILDSEVIAIHGNANLDGDEKCFQYHRAVERYLYKKDPSFKPGQFEFETREGSDGRVTHAFRKKRGSRRRRLLRYLTAAIGPSIGAVLGIVIRFCCCTPSSFETVVV